MNGMPITVWLNTTTCSVFFSMGLCFCWGQYSYFFDKFMIPSPLYILYIQYMYVGHKCNNVYDLKQSIYEGKNLIKYLTKIFYLISFMLKKKWFYHAKYFIQINFISYPKMLLSCFYLQMFNCIYLKNQYFFIPQLFHLPLW